jgi:hypothetical protein
VSYLCAPLLIYSLDDTPSLYVLAYIAVSIFHCEIVVALVYVFILQSYVVVDVCFIE